MGNIQVFGSKENLKKVEKFCKKNKIEYLKNMFISNCEVKNHDYIIKSLALRKNQKDIAKELDLSISTIEKRVKDIKKYYKVKSINELLNLMNKNYSEVV